MRINLKLPANGKRLIYNLAAFGLPEVPYLAAQNLPFTTLALPTHLHKGCMEINHILKGERVYRVGGKDYHLRGNQVFITWPDEVHGSGSYLHGRGLHFWMQIRLPKPGRPFLGFGAKRAAPLLDALWNLPKRQFHAGPEMRGLYARMLHLCREGPSPLAAMEMSALLAEWLLDVAGAASDVWEDDISPDIAKTLQVMEDNPMRHYSVSELAEAACLSESRFKGKFRDQVGVPPGEYLQRRRLEMAARKLLKGRRTSITDVALDLGFASSQHFSTVFKKFFGTSPAVWIREFGQNGAERKTENGIRPAKDKDGYIPWVDEEGRLHGYICGEET